MLFPVLKITKHICFFLLFFLVCACALCNRQTVCFTAGTQEDRNRVLVAPIVSHILVVVFIVLGVEAVEDGASKGEDGGPPGQAVAPVKLMIHP